MFPMAAILLVSTKRMQQVQLNKGNNAGALEIRLRSVVQFSVPFFFFNMKPTVQNLCPNYIIKQIKANLWNIKGVLKYSSQRQFRSYTHHIQEHQKKQQNRKSTDNSPRCALLFICSSSSKELYSFSVPSRIASLSFIMIGDRFLKLLKQSVNESPLVRKSCITSVSSNYNFLMLFPIIIQRCTIAKKLTSNHN